MMRQNSAATTDPVLPDQGGRDMPGDPGQPGKEHIVRRRAYELFEQRGMKHGYDLQDWLDAEAQLRAEALNSEVVPDIETPRRLVAT